MFNKKNKAKTTFGIIGLGRFGMALALGLAEAGEEIIVLDKNEEKVREMREYTENAYVVPSLDKASLTEVGLQNCDVAVVCIGEKMDTSILTTLHLVDMGVGRVISKANGPEHGEVLKKLGAEVVYPEQDMALRLANRLKNSNIIDFVQLSERINVTKLTAPLSFIGKTVIESELRRKFGLNIIAMESEGKVIENITPDYTFKKDDLLFLAGSREGLNKLAEESESLT